MVTPASAERCRELQTAFESIQSKVDAASASRSTTSPPARLVAVSKKKPSSDILALYDLGVRHFGENYPQELVEKAAELPSDINWHFIGSLQSNKCKLLASVPNLFALETLSTIKSADLLETAIQVLDPPRSTRLNVFLQVNTSGEDSKAGLPPLHNDPATDSASELVALSLHILSSCPHLRLRGLMTIGSVAASTSSEHNPDFASLTHTRSRLVQVLKGLNDARIAQGVEEMEREELELSMGMSNDFVEAIQQGSGNVRVGSSIFGARPAPTAA